MTPRYPVYVPSKGRADLGYTARCLLRDGVPFRLVVEPPDAAAYVERFGAERVLVLPFADLGQGSIPARNWIREHAEAAGHARHWQLDDNMTRFARLWRGVRIECPAGVALRVMEDFADRYENVAVTGPCYEMFCTSSGTCGSGDQPFVRNVHVYSCVLVSHAFPGRWRGRYNEDTDLCLQALAGGWCTVLFYAFLVQKLPTMKLRGGNTDKLYRGDGRLRMARSLERRWPGVVTTVRRWGRPQHYVRWDRFATPLRLRPGVDLAALPRIDDYGLELAENVGTRPARALTDLGPTGPRPVCSRAK